MKLLVCLLLSFSIFASAKVEKVKGKVTALLPGMKKAVTLSKGFMVPEDTSILTRNRSFVKLSYPDGSSMFVGPKSKIVVSKIVTKKRSGVVNLLNGQLRAKIKKSERERNLNNKLIIRTRTASMGVRGTDFLVVFNKDNKASSLVTFEGEVAIVKEIKTKTDIEKVDKMLAASKKSVKQGQFAGTNENERKISGVVDVDEMQITSLDKATTNLPVLDKKSLKSAKKSIVDLNTAQALKPEMGKVDRITGMYYAPEGVELTTKGFVSSDIDNRESSDVSSRFNAMLNKTPVNYRFNYFMTKYSFRSDLTGDLKAAYRDSDILRHDFKVTRLSGLHRTYANVGLFSVEPEFRGCSFCTTSRMNDESRSFKDISLGYEYNFSTRLKLGVETGLTDRPIISYQNNSVMVDKSNAYRFSLRSRVNLASYKKFYLFTAQRVDLMKVDNTDGISNGFELSLGLDYLFNKKYGVSADVKIGREKLENGSTSIENQTGGIGIGILYNFD